MKYIKKYNLTFSKSEQIENENNYQTDWYSQLYNLIYDRKYFEIKELLRNKKLDLNVSKNGESPLNLAIKCIFYDPSLIELLISYGADVNYCDDHGHPPLVTAIKTEATNVNVLRLLIDNGADWNLTDNKNKDFLDYLSYNKTRDWIIKNYPDKYQEYLIKKDAGKYNL